MFCARVLLCLHFICFTFCFYNEEYESNIVFPKIRDLAKRKRREISRSFHYEESIPTKIIEFNDWMLELDQSGLKILEDEGSANCEYFHGKLRGMEDLTWVALTICDEAEIMGLVRIGGENFFVEPIESNVTGEDVPHSLYYRKRRSVIGQEERPWEFFNLTGDTADFDWAEEEVAQEEISGSVRDAINIKFIDHHEIDEDVTGYFVDSAWESRNIYNKPSGSPAFSAPQWLQIAMAVDHTVINFHGKSKVKRYVLSLMNIVNAIYQDPSLDANLQLVITRLLLYESKKSSVIRLGDAKKSLQNVNVWNRKLHQSLGPGEPDHDLAVWLTRTDIGGPSGYAPVSGVCDPKRSCTLNRDEGLTSAFIIAHEIAHALGLSHDGEQKAGNTCGGDAFYGSIMAPMVSSTFHKFVWSDCSKREYHKKTSKLACLSNPPQQLGEMILNSTLQSAFSLDEQCRMEFGDGYSLCRSFDIVDTCSHLWCGHRDSPVVCKTKKGPPLEGTECGFDKWCINGYCESVDTRRFGREPVHHNPQDGDWGRWVAWGPCSRSCGTGVEFRMRKCDNPPPLYGGANCIGPAEEWRVCTLDECPEPIRDFRAQQCALLPHLLDFEHAPKGNMTWLPYESEEHDAKCKLICISRETRELYVTDENLMDGTLCSYESDSDICIQGVCYNLGCDGVLYSDAKLDECGICSGNNSDCRIIKSFYHKRLKRDVSRLVVIPKSARDIQIEANFSSANSIEPAVAFLIKDRSRHSFSVSIPNKGAQGEVISGTKFHYRKSGRKNRIWAKGPPLSEIVVALYASKSDVDRGVDISFTSQYRLNKNFRPNFRFAWVLGGWGQCSKNCGGGKRQKTVACFDTQNGKIVPRRMCSLIAKPHLESEACNIFSCSFYWIPGQWEPCSKTCGSHGVQYREIYCVTQSANHTATRFDHGSPARCEDTPPETARPCNRNPCPLEWSYGAWSQCSTSCGTGISVRHPYCKHPDENESSFTCGTGVDMQKKRCKGVYNRTTSVECRTNRKRKICVGDVSVHCSIPLLAKYCRLSGFRRLCCETCSRNKLTRIVQ